ncbi:hypothetical protein [Enterococcus wangshanyuanii]|uniref:HTH merR-type domain-containing protein n=1 Tax=Enterococcus wangshanyuanii TaxID=2005703 RepID=A0ABQ1PX35_9ENTE|nr:hypothetical protein [Enterococcus wangshanyuanii]GGD05838.1 hypothetical protein GCM10011573_39090 [Enterococcus wangshanyuanii]
MYSFDEVIQELNGAISLKTLKNWANKIEKVTDIRFVRKYAKNTTGRSYGYKVFSFDQIEQFKKVVSMREQNIPLDKAILNAFLSDEEKEQMETIEVRKKEYEEFRNDTKQLIKLAKKVLEENEQLKSKILSIEEMGENKEVAT